MNEKFDGGKTAMKTKLLFIIFSFLIVNSFAQSTDSVFYKKNVFSLEVLGNGVLYSANYERKLSKKQNKFYTLRIGFMAVPDNNNNGFILPVLINHVINNGKGNTPYEINNHIEVGGGIGILYGRESKKDNLSLTGNDKCLIGLNANLMYRYQKPNGKFVFRIGWTPSFYFLDYSNEASLPLLLIWPGASFGYAF